MVISHDADFLNAFSNGVLYLDVYTKKVEQYAGNYNDVLKDITARVERENMKNAHLVAKRMKELAEDLEEEMVDVRKEDKTIKNFIIPFQEDLIGEIISITSYTIAHPKTHKIIKKTAKISLKKNNHLLLRGPNGIGKTTLLENIAAGNEGSNIVKGVRVGYYRQDFSTLNFDDTVKQCLSQAMLDGGERLNEERMRSIAASFLITGEIINTKIGALSEGQKGLVAFARLVLLRPGLLILDEPTNHINFRHLPVIAKALSDYQGSMIMVSHVAEFVSQIRIDEVLDLEK